MTLPLPTAMQGRSLLVSLRENKAGEIQRSINFTAASPDSGFSNSPTGLL
jgi:hypothetical protein